MMLENFIEMLSVFQDRQSLSLLLVNVDLNASRTPTLAKILHRIFLSASTVAMWFRIRFHDYHNNSNSRRGFQSKYWNLNLFVKLHNFRPFNFSFKYKLFHRFSLSTQMLPFDCTTTNENRKQCHQLSNLSWVQLKNIYFAVILLHVWKH